MKKYLIFFFLLNCHFVEPEQCTKMCKPKGVKQFNNYFFGFISNNCECKRTYFESANKKRGYEIKIKEIVEK